MKKLFLLLILLAFMFPFDAFSQDEKKNGTSEPKTQSEAIHGKISATIIEGYSVVGKVNVDDRRYSDSVISVENWEFIVPSTDEKQIGIVVEIKSREQSNRSLIDYDEIDPLLQGIDYLLKVNRHSVKLDNFQAIYRTKDGLRVTTSNHPRDETFGRSQGDIEATVKSGNGAVISFSIHKLRALQSLIAKAKQQLDLIK